MLYATKESKIFFPFPILYDLMDFKNLSLGSAIRFLTNVLLAGGTKKTFPQNLPVKLHNLPENSHDPALEVYLTG